MATLATCTHLDQIRDTLLAVLGAKTSRVRLLTNVADLPLRPPAMLAKAAATLDILTERRVELGLGAGAFWDAIASYGGPRRAPGAAVQALEETITVMRLIWGRQGTGAPVSFAGQYYQLTGARAMPTMAAGRSTSRTCTTSTLEPNFCASSCTAATTLAPRSGSLSIAATMRSNIPLFLLDLDEDT